MKTKSLLLLSVIAALVPALRAGVEVDVFTEVRLGRALPPPPREVIIVERVGAPGLPPWAAAHASRRSYGLLLLRGQRCLYRPGDRMWFYLEGGNWRVGAQLPSSLHR